jgi:cytochrome c oxidase assembly protein subunit 15
MQGGIVVTGGAVRLTGSGLGCPTWPECTPGSFTPVPHQAQGTLHSWIEFGNRLLTFALVFISIAALIGAFKWSKNTFSSSEKRAIRLLALGQFLGIFAQGILGGITVLTHLNPIPVAGHFLLSLPLIAGALSLRRRILQSSDSSSEKSLQLSPITVNLAKLVIALAAVVITLGTVVTGSGPHAGDEKAKRFGFDPRVVSWLHADVVIALIFLTIALLLVVRISEKHPKFYRAIWAFLAICLSQGLIGYVQYFTGLPEIIVGIHLLGATLVWGTAWNLKLVGGFRYLTKEKAEH